MTTSLPEDQRLINLSSKAYEHPADKAATAALQQIPALDVVVRKLIEFGYERALRQQLLSSSVRLGEDQLPAIWADWNAVCARLDLPERHDLYLTQFPITNAAAIGSEKPMVVVNSRCVDLLDELEVRTVLGHEAGHILSDHVLYITALHILVMLSRGARLPFIAGLPLQAVKVALFEWYRAAELSSDRAATLVNRDPLVTCRTMMVLAGGGQLAQAQPRRVHPAGDRLRGVELRLGQAQPDAQRPVADPRPAGPPRQGDHGVGAVRRVRPDRGRRVPDARAAGRRAQGGRRGVRALQGALPPHLQRVRRRERGREGRRRAGEGRGRGREGRGLAASRAASRTPGRSRTAVAAGHAHGHGTRTATRPRPTPTGAGSASRSG